MASIKATSLAQVDTLYSADSIEFCPFEGFKDLFVCGTYQIVEPETKTLDEASHPDEEVQTPRKTQRVGRLLLFQVHDEQLLEEIQRIETSAILDTKWSPYLEQGPRLAAADAKGRITIYELNVKTRQLEEIQRIDVEEESTLCLSLDFSHQLHPSVPPSIITSISNGSLAYLTPSPTGHEIVSAWRAHDFEPWITAFDLQDPMTIWSGGDDCKLKRWDLRQTRIPTFVNKNFEAGVTTITPSPHTAHLLAVGSYDENLRLFDTRSTRQPLLTIPIGGGIWRTRFHPDHKRAGDVLIACMHDGFKIIQLSRAISNGSWENEESKTGNIVKSFDQHSSLAYGADWCKLPLKDGQSLVATCSFYDHALHLWRG
ncbi:uncharacterized protein L203_105711 [Cryptococcus depauperatus CBS 7841]|uniref:methylated diphthine methylhydrolase n=1 Tax=Cryptococcus depauperatus CBS 7841 TaxID=1295531 RepID=A0AAJ8M2U2_9TREE